MQVANNRCWMLDVGCLRKGLQRKSFPDFYRERLKRKARPAGIRPNKN